MNKTSKVFLSVLLIASIGGNAYLLVIARWNYEQIESMSEHMRLTLAAEKIKKGSDKVIVYKLTERLPDTIRPTDHGTTVASWTPDSHTPFLHRMRFGSGPGNGSYYLDVEFDTNETVVDVHSGNF